MHNRLHRSLILSLAGILACNPTSADDPQRVTSVDIGFSLVDDGRQVVVRSLLNDGPADKAGVQPGDRILGINDVEINSLVEAQEAFSSPSREAFRLILERESDQLVLAKIEGPKENTRASNKSKTTKDQDESERSHFLNMNNLTPYARKQVEAALRGTNDDDLTGDSTVADVALSPTDWAVPSLEPTAVPIARASSNSAPTLVRRVSSTAGQNIASPITTSFAQQLSGSATTTPSISPSGVPPTSTPASLPTYNTDNGIATIQPPSYAATPSSISPRNTAPQSQRPRVAPSTTRRPAPQPTQGGFFQRWRRARRAAPR